MNLLYWMVFSSTLVFVWIFFFFWFQYFYSGRLRYKDNIMYLSLKESIFIVQICHMTLFNNDSIFIDKHIIISYATIVLFSNLNKFSKFKTHIYHRGHRYLLIRQRNH